MKKISQSIFLSFLNLMLYFRFFRTVMRFRKKVGYYPNIAVPVLYNEKMLWRKVFDHNPLFEIFCDKLATKDYIQKICPDLQSPKTIWRETDLDSALKHPLQRNLVVKANHGCNFNFFTNASNVSEYKQKLHRWYNTTYGLKNLEWAYTKVKKIIFAEELILCDLPTGLIEINVRCVDGQALLCSIILDNKTKEMKAGYFDLNGKPILSGEDGLSKLGQLDADFVVPEAFFEAIRYAEILSKGVDYARYDFMYNGKDFFAGEITVYPSAGLTRVKKDDKLSFDVIVNNGWDIKKSWFLNTPHSGWRAYYSRALMGALA